MFKKFSPDSDVSTSTAVKASVQRSLKSQLLQQNKNITEEQLEELLPKKSPLIQYKVGPHMMLYCKRVAKSSSGGDNNDDADGHEDDQYDEDDAAAGGSPSDVPVLFQQRDGPVLPTLKLVHAYHPSLEFQHVRVDQGAIPFLLGGANVMCPGLTHPNGYMPADGEDGEDAQGFEKPGLEKGAGVVIFAHGKEHALAVGVLTMSSAEIRDKNKGIGIELLHFLGDGLYQTDEI